MGKQYVFWREPNGNPHRKGDEKHAPNRLIAEIGSKATVSPNGVVSWPLLSTDRHELAVRTAAVVIDPNGDELNESDASTIMKQAIQVAAKKAGSGKPFSPKDLLDAANRIAADHFRKPIAEYFREVIERDIEKFCSQPALKSFDDLVRSSQQQTLLLMKWDTMTASSRRQRMSR